MSSGEEKSPKRGNDGKFGEKKDPGARPKGPAPTHVRERLGRLSRRDLGTEPKMSRKESPSLGRDRLVKRGRAPSRSGEPRRFYPRSSSGEDTTSDSDDGWESPPRRVILKSQVGLPVDKAECGIQTGRNVSRKHSQRSKAKRAERNRKRADRRRKKLLIENPEQGTEQATGSRVARPERSSRGIKLVSRGWDCERSRPTQVGVSVGGDCLQSCPVSGCPIKAVNIEPHVSGFHGAVQGMEPCPIPGCPIVAINIEPHVRSTHILAVFAEAGNHLVHIRLRALQTLALMVVGRADVYSLVSWVNRQGKKWPLAIESRTLGAMRDLCTVGGWSVPERLSISPLNSPGALLHWRVQALLMAEIGERRATELKEMYPVDVTKHQVSDLAGMYRPRLGISSIDTHFHLDRAWIQGKLPGRPDVNRYMKLTLPTSPQMVHVDIRGGVIVNCDPKTWPSDKELEVGNNWVVAMGVHPKKARELDDERAYRLETLLATGKLKVLGEVGIDLSLGSPSLEVQCSTLRWVLRMAAQHPEVKLVIHVRGGRGDVHSAKAHSLCLKECRDRLSPTHPIHIHCFEGGREEACGWLENFHNAHFGFTSAVLGFDREQLAVLDRLPRDRILLESDAPYFRPAWVPNSGLGHPRYLGEVAKGIAAARQGASVEGVLQEGGHNALRFYGLRV